MLKLKTDTDGYVEGYADAGYDMEGAAEYSGEAPAGFDAGTCRHYRLAGGALVLDAGSQAEARSAETAREELAALHRWFTWYDVQIMQFTRAQRLGEPFDGDVQRLDAQAKANQLRVRALNRAVTRDTD